MKFYFEVKKGPKTYRTYKGFSLFCGTLKWKNPICQLVANWTISARLPDFTKPIWAASTSMGWSWSNYSVGFFFFFLSIVTQQLHNNYWFVRWHSQSFKKFSGNETRLVNLLRFSRRNLYLSTAEGCYVSERIHHCHSD